MASGPSSSAGRFGPAATCHSRTVPTSAPSCSSTSDRPSAGMRPSRRRSQVFWNAGGAEAGVEQRLAGLDVGRKVSSRIVIMAVPPRGVG